MTHVLTIVNQDQLDADAASASGTRPSSCRTTASAACRRPTRRSRSSSTARRSATSRPRRSSKIKGGNSNWRGPIWFPTCFLLIESLRKLGKAFGPTFARATRRPRRPADHVPARWPASIADRLIRIFTRDAAGPAAGLRRHAQVPGRPALARPDPVLRILPRRQRRRPGRVAPDGLDGAGRLADRRVAALTAAVFPSAPSPRRAEIEDSGSLHPAYRRCRMVP